ncbi:MAG: biotin carboxylase N-terminal domain-containing protein [Myxococcota bacterium]
MRTQTAPQNTDLLAAVQACVGPRGINIGCNAVFATLAADAWLPQLRSLPLGRLGHRLVALRFLIANGDVWLRHFAWEPPLAKKHAEGPTRLLNIWARVQVARTVISERDTWARLVDTTPLVEFAAHLESDGDEGLRLLVALHRHPELVKTLRTRLHRDAATLMENAPRVADVIELATYDLTRLPATTVGEGDLAYVIVADKGEMGVRAVREAVAFGATPVVLFSEADDANSLQVRLAKKFGGFTIGLKGSFRESYANARQIAERVHAAYKERFGAKAEVELARSALYPGYGPLAENSAAIQVFREEGIVFIGPMQDVVERAGDKRKFRQLAQAIDPTAVTPGIMIEETDADAITAAIAKGHEAGHFSFPGRLKAANGGGGRGQVVIGEPAGVPAAVQRVLGEIKANGWDHGVMFEQNIPETIHLEVQVLRDRFGNTRHFGMRDCTEQRASQKIQEEAPPALLRDDPALAERICNIATRIADDCGYVGACTVELMYKGGKFYLLEMNTRIQVEHPVTEEAHRIRQADGTLAKLDLPALQFLIASGRPIPFPQSAVVNTHVAREFRINAETWRADLKDPRDGKQGLFLPNAGTFDVIELPKAEEIRQALTNAGVRGVAEVNVRFDVGFEAGDTLVNKDPTFGKLIVAVAAEPGFESERYELLRLASLEVLSRMRIEGRQVMPTGAVIPDSRFHTNIEAHQRILETEMIREHGLSTANGRHVGWVVSMLRGA